MAAPAGKVLGTAIVRVFGLLVVITGLSERSAKAAGYNPDSAIVHAAHHATYYPGAQPLHLKIIYDRSSGKVLGAQAAGGEGVDKRLDVIATAIHFGAAVDDLTTLDLAYAPQFGSAKDPVHLAAFVAQNQLRGLTPAIAADQVTDQFILDVRTPQEVAAGTLAGAVDIPSSRLRGEVRAAITVCTWARAIITSRRRTPSRRKSPA